MYQRLISGLFVFFLAASFTSAFAKVDATRTPPPPVDNKVLDSMVGTWQGEGEMMGTKMNDTLKVSWSLNHQFLLFQLLAQAADNSKQYEGMGMFGVEANNKIKTWWFDSWGANHVSTGTGNIQNNKLTLHDGNTQFSEQRSFQVDGNQMIMQAKGSMHFDGKNQPFEQNVIYKKVG